MGKAPAVASSSATRPDRERRFQLVATCCRRSFMHKPLSETAAPLALRKRERHGRTVSTALGAGASYERGVEDFKRTTGT